ncbi:MAG: tripartite tricarboxylate transporter substrate binding protein [Burkholderiaceae bacterium]
MRTQIKFPPVKLPLALAAMTIASSVAMAADFPTKQLTVIVGYSAGGGTDTIVRSMTDPLAKVLGQKILVQNVGGAGGGVAAVRVSKADADGYTLLATTSSTFSLEPQTKKTIYKNGDFKHVATIAQFQGVMFANKDKPYASLTEMIDKAKAENRPIKFASFFQLDKLVMQYIGKRAGVEMIPVPVKGGNGAVKAVLGGEVDAGYSGGSWAPHVQAGAAKALFATSYDRLGLAPDVPAMKDLGYDIGTTSYLTVSAPANTPDAVVKQLSAAIKEALAQPGPQEAGKKRFMDMTYYDDVATRKIIDKEIAAFGEMVKTVGK